MTQRYEVREVEVYPNNMGDMGQFTLEDGEEIVNTARPSPNRIIFTITRPTTATQCVGITQSGTRCKRDAAEDSNYCSMHENNE